MKMQRKINLKSTKKDLVSIHHEICTCKEQKNPRFETWELAKLEVMRSQSDFQIQG